MTTNLDDMIEEILTRKPTLWSRFMWKMRRLRKLPRDSYFKIKWFIQRGKRGWADVDVWSLDYYFAKVIRDSTLHLEKTDHGHPSNLTSEEWSLILKTISSGFDDYIKQQYSDDMSEDEIDELFILFRKYYRHLWD